MAAYGSSQSGFGVRSSDLDITLHREPPKEDRANKDDAVLVLKSIKRELQKCSRLFTTTCAIFRARVPVLKLRYREWLDVDLSVHNTLPLCNTRLLKGYASFGSHVVELGLAVKLWARGHKLCGADIGHLSSYSLLLMVIYFLQVRQPRLLPSLQRAAADDRAFGSDRST
ncbi:unnamed protein product, partial [Prorocentrum cordatum]